MIRSGSRAVSRSTTLFVPQGLRTSMCRAPRVSRTAPGSLGRGPPRRRSRTGSIQSWAVQPCNPPYIGRPRDCATAPRRHCVSSLCPLGGCPGAPPHERCPDALPRGCAAFDGNNPTPNCQSIVITLCAGVPALPEACDQRNHYGCGWRAPTLVQGQNWFASAPHWPPAAAHMLCAGRAMQRTLEGQCPVTTPAAAAGLPHIRRRTAPPQWPAHGTPPARRHPRR